MLQLVAIPIQMGGKISDLLRTRNITISEDLVAQLKDISDILAVSKKCCPACNATVEGIFVPSLSLQKGQGFARSHILRNDLSEAKEREREYKNRRITAGFSFPLFRFRKVRGFTRPHLLRNDLSEAKERERKYENRRITAEAETPPVTNPRNIGFLLSARRPAT
jgi:hypothetical protein